MTRQELYKIRKKYIDAQPYTMAHHSEYNYKILDNIMYERRAGRGTQPTYNNVVIMADTETSKSKKNDIVYKDGKKTYIPVDNYVVAWTISIRAFDKNIVTLYGHKPTTLVDTIDTILKHMQGDKTFLYFHNLAYDYVFIRQFLFDKFGYPDKQLNTKSHYPISIEFANGLILRDSLILAQRSILKWAKDLNTPHQKAVGCWDYDIIRRYEPFTQDELKYIECDTLAGVECIDTTRKILNKHLYAMPLTATGIPREECRTRGKQYHAHDNLLRQALTFEQYLKMLQVYHGGYVHADRHLTDITIDSDFMNGDIMRCFDFSSSYPYCMIAYKYPSEKFVKTEDRTPEEILKNADNYAYTFKLILVKPRLKDDSIVMPSLQFSKCVQTINPVLDNGRILTCAYAEIYLNEVDLSIIYEQYDAKAMYCVEVELAKKDYLPRWFTDYVFELYKAKCELKPYTDENGKLIYDPVAMSMIKSKLNSLYGMLVSRSIRETITENYETGEYTVEDSENPKELYDKYLDNKRSIFPYQAGVYVTSYAMRNLFTLGQCCKNWVYSDTDSCFGFGWDIAKVEEYNNHCKELIRANGYNGVIVRGREYWLGIAELDKEMKGFRTQGAKRYAYVDLEDNLKITVAGVPKETGKGCLSSLDEFTKGLIFDGVTTGKKTHTYIYKEKYKDDNGIWYADSIDLTPCDYLLDDIEHLPWEKIFEEEILLQTYEE